MKKCYVTNYPKKEYFKETEFSIKVAPTTQITVDFKKERQTLVGFGGAFTEAAAYVYHKTPIEIQKEIIRLYFDKETGLGYQLGRASINSSDFGLSNYDYIPKGATNLKDFSMYRDYKDVIPMIKDAMEYAPDLEMKAAPWSPPRHYKTNNDMNYGGKLLKAYYGLWADYMIKYIEEMQKNGINIKYLSIQNEPEATQTWDSCRYEPEDACEFVKVLGPKLQRKNMDVKIIVLDHNRDILVKWAEAFKNDEEALKYTWGLGVHWYVCEDFEALSKAKKIVPQLELLFTEGCVEGGPKPYELFTGERYARNIIGDLNNYCIGYIDWNLILNEKGGPNHVGNFCDAPLLWKNNSLVINSSYYYIGHFAKYLRRGSKIVESKTNNPNLRVLSGINELNEQVVVILNQTDKDITYRVNGTSEDLIGTSSAHTIQTWIVK